MSDPTSKPTRDATAAASSLAPVTGTGAETLGFAPAPDGSTPPARIGCYALLNELGRGGMGVVYRAEDPRLKREVALKVMLPQFAANPQAKARFVREARAQAKVENDHVAAIHQVEEHDGLPYLVMPLLKGMTLHAALKANPRPPLMEVIRIGREMAEGLAAAHEKGLVHRDIKPANIWLEGKKLRVKVLDFGLARVADAADESEGPVTREGAVVGTPAYMSPEQGRGEAVDARTDLWSLGVVLYQMTTGELPFKGANMMAVLTSLGMDTPAAPIVKNPAVPPPLSDFVMRLLAKDPASRPPTAEVAAEELRGIETGLANAVRVIPLDAPPPLIVVSEGPDPFAALDATEMSAPNDSTADDEPLAVPPSGRRGFPVWATVAGVVLTVGAVVGVVLSQMGKKPVDVVTPDGPEKKLPVSRDPKGSVAPTPGDPFVLKFGNPAVEMRFRWIPPGKFRRGNPAREITISKGFWMAETECTKAQWKAVMGTDPSGRKGDNLPAEEVMWDEAQVFCEKAAKISGKAVRLPTEAQWEYACRAGSSTEYNTGDGEESLRRAGWYVDNAGGKPHPVGELESNAWGLRDMHGNVWEWCEDWYEGDYYSKGPTNDPVCLDNQTVNNVLRGGSWRDEFGRCRAAYRNNNPPGIRNPCVGFRICLRAESGGIASDPDRIGAEYALSIGGSVRVNDENRVIKAAAELPQEPFRLTLITLANNPQVTDIGLANFKDCKNVTLLRLDHTKIGDSGLANLNGCRNLTELWLGHTQVTDAGLRGLVDKSKLIALNIPKTQVTAEGVKALAAALPQCKIQWDGGIIEPRKSPDRLAAEYVLSVGGTVRANGEIKDIKAVAELPKAQFVLTHVTLHVNLQLNDAELAHFKDLKNLVRLSLVGTKLSDAALANFKDCTTLAYLSLQSTPVTDAGLVHLKKLTKLTTLHVHSTKVGNEGLETIKDFKDLVDLRLSGTKVSDAGLEHLKEMKVLAQLHLRATKVTEAGVKQLAAALPQCKIEWDGGTIEPKK